MKREAALKYAKDDLWSIHMEWLLENKPDLVKRLFEKDRNQLLMYLSRKTHQGATLEFNLQEKGLPRDQIEELVLGQVIAPPPPENPPEPLPEPLVNRIRIWADNLTE